MKRILGLILGLMTALVAHAGDRDDVVNVERAVIGSYTNGYLDLIQDQLGNKQGLFDELISGSPASAVGPVLVSDGSSAAVPVSGGVSYTDGILALFSNSFTEDQIKQRLLNNIVVLERLLLATASYSDYSSFVNVSLAAKQQVSALATSPLESLWRTLENVALYSRSALVNIVLNSIDSPAPSYVAPVPAYVEPVPAYVEPASVSSSVVGTNASQLAGCGVSINPGVDDAALDKYVKMLKRGVPAGAVGNKMISDRVATLAGAISVSPASSAPSTSTSVGASSAPVVASAPVPTAPVSASAVSDNAQAILTYIQGTGITPAEVAVLQTKSDDDLARFMGQISNSLLLKQTPDKVLVALRRNNFLGSVAPSAPATAPSTSASAGAGASSVVTPAASTVVAPAPSAVLSNAQKILNYLQGTGITTDEIAGLQTKSDDQLKSYVGRIPITLIHQSPEEMLRALRRNNLLTSAPSAPIEPAPRPAVSSATGIGALLQSGFASRGRFHGAVGDDSDDDDEDNDWLNDSTSGSTSSFVTASAAPLASSLPASAATTSVAVPIAAPVTGTTSGGASAVPVVHLPPPAGPRPSALATARPTAGVDESVLAEIAQGVTTSPVERARVIRDARTALNRVENQEAQLKLIENEVLDDAFSKAIVAYLIRGKIAKREDFADRGKGDQFDAWALALGLS